MESKEDANSDGANRIRKFGLPNWMMNNIERLNFATDFEQYACSPPESESFLTENMDSCDLHEAFAAPAVSSKLSEDQPKIVSDNKAVSESKSSPNLMADAPEVVSPTLKAKVPELVSPISLIEELYSSPDTTPCATPEPSPLPRRRYSGQYQYDTVQTNPGKWFYLGNAKKPEPNVKGQILNIANNKVNKIKQTGDSPNKVKSPIKQKKDGLKLVISNFDINAISPSSW